jgi:hypothetical protein
VQQLTAVTYVSCRRLLLPGTTAYVRLVELRSGNAANVIDMMHNHVQEI